jgi:two-component system, chemotaxis family, protein-glutamate methylesterase/glutaminase
MALVVVGASLGGVAALRVLLEALPAGFPLPIVIVQHRGVDGGDALSAMLRLHCTMPVGDAEDKQPLEAGHVYVAPEGYHLLVEPGSLALSTEGRVVHARPSIDVLFESAADSYGSQVICIVLTCASADGAHGAARIKARGGIVIAQHPSTAESSVLIDAVIAAGTADHVVPLAAIGPFVLATVKSWHPARGHRG